MAWRSMSASFRLPHLLVATASKSAKLQTRIEKRGPKRVKTFCDTDPALWGGGTICEGGLGLSKKNTTIHNPSLFSVPLTHKKMHGIPPPTAPCQCQCPMPRILRQNWSFKINAHPHVGRKMEPRRWGSGSTKNQSITVKK